MVQPPHDRQCLPPPAPRSRARAVSSITELMVPVRKPCLPPYRAALPRQQPRLPRNLLRHFPRPHIRRDRPWPVPTGGPPHAQWQGRTGRDRIALIRLMFQPAFSPRVIMDSVTEASVLRALSVVRPRAEDPCIAYTCHVIIGPLEGGVPWGWGGVPWGWGGGVPCIAYTWRA